MTSSKSSSLTVSIAGLTTKCNKLEAQVEILKNLVNTVLSENKYLKTKFDKLVSNPNDLSDKMFTTVEQAVDKMGQRLDTKVNSFLESKISNTEEKIIAYMKKQSQKCEPSCETNTKQPMSSTEKSLSKSIVIHGLTPSKTETPKHHIIEFFKTALNISVPIKDVTLIGKSKIPVHIITLDNPAHRRIIFQNCHKLKTFPQKLSVCDDISWEERRMKKMRRGQGKQGQPRHAGHQGQAVEILQKVNMHRKQQASLFAFIDDNVEKTTKQALKKKQQQLRQEIKKISKRYIEKEGYLHLASCISTKYQSMWNDQHEFILSSQHECLYDRIASSLSSNPQDITQFGLTADSRKAFLDDLTYLLQQTKKWFDCLPICACYCMDIAQKLYLDIYHRRSMDYEEE